ncbi:unnamed protein product [Heligmosomoides polygyrus]|uniref:MFS domain-containing protein n=1 Tax=Heligmosomoides polygyrus TaxID=6339 RepID=A0A3P7Z550_HELPZ|nr:unnamed protein product [Heligmosomoides polygyrus]
MGFNVPILNRDSDAVRAATKQWVEQPQNQKKLVLVIVSVALLLDNMLYMVIVPIIPKYLRDIHAYEVEFYGYHNETERLPNGTVIVRAVGAKIDYLDEDMELGWLFASKALLQIFVNPMSGYIIDRIGYELPMVIGLVVMFSSTAIFALGRSYSVLFFARSLQGFGSAFADTSGLAMIADRFSEEGERSAALGIALAFISFGFYVTVKLLRAFPHHTWAIASVGLAMEGIACLSVPYTTSVMQLIIPLSFVCFGIALVDTSLLPMLGHLVDTRHVPVYGSVYAIADISYSLAYAFGPIMAGWIVGNMSFFALNVIIFLSNILYAPVIFLLRRVHGYDSLAPKAEMTTLKNDTYDQIQAGNGATETTAAHNYQPTDYGTQPSNYQNSFPQAEYPAGFDPLNPQW